MSVASLVSLFLIGVAVREFQKCVLMIQTDIMHELADLKRQSVLSSLSVDSAEVDIRPAETMADFHELDDRCSNSVTSRKGRNWLMHNSLMALFSMKDRSTKKGELGKLVFQKSSVYEVVQAQDCPRGFELHENMCYHFSGGEETWIRAYLSCQLFDSQLVEIESAEEDEYLRNKTISIGNKHYFWIGLTDKLIEGEYVWETSKDLITPGDYINWGLGEPDNADENCVFLAPSRNYTWADSDCTRTEHYICETDPNIGAVVG